MHGIDMFAVIREAGMTLFGTAINAVMGLLCLLLVGFSSAILSQILKPQNPGKRSTRRMNDDTKHEHIRDISLTTEGKREQLDVLYKAGLLDDKEYTEKLLKLR